MLIAFVARTGFFCNKSKLTASENAVFSIILVALTVLGAKPFLLSPPDVNKETKSCCTWAIDTKQDEYTNDGNFVGSQQRNDYIGIVEIDYKQFKPIIDYAYANAPVAPGSEPNLKQKRWQPVASSYTKAMVYVNPDSIKDLPDGNMALEFMFDSPPNALVLEGYVDKNDQFHVGKYKLYNGIHCRTVEQGNNELPYPSLRTGAKDAIEMARHLQKKYNLH